MPQHQQPSTYQTQLHCRRTLTQPKMSNTVIEFPRESIFQQHSGQLYWLTLTRKEDQTCTFQVGDVITAYIYPKDRQTIYTSTRELPQALIIAFQRHIQEDGTIELSDITNDAEVNDFLRNIRSTADQVRNENASAAGRAAAALRALKMSRLFLNSLSWAISLNAVFSVQPNLIAQLTNQLPNTLPGDTHYVIRSCVNAILGAYAHQSLFTANEQFINDRFGTRTLEPGQLSSAGTVVHENTGLLIGLLGALNVALGAHGALDRAQTLAQRIGTITATFTAGALSIAFLQEIWNAASVSSSLTNRYKRVVLWDGAKRKRIFRRYLSNFVPRLTAEYMYAIKLRFNTYIVASFASIITRGFAPYIGDSLANALAAIAGNSAFVINIVGAGMYARYNELNTDDTPDPDTRQQAYEAGDYDDTHDNHNEDTPHPHKQRPGYETDDYKDNNDDHNECENEYED